MVGYQVPQYIFFRIFSWHAKLGSIVRKWVINLNKLHFKEVTPYEPLIHPLPNLPPKTSIRLFGNLQVPTSHSHDHIGIVVHRRASGANAAGFVWSFWSFRIDILEDKSDEKSDVSHACMSSMHSSTFLLKHPL